MTTQIGNHVIDTETGEILGKPVTDAQRNTMMMIEKNTGHIFRGNTYQDAWKFINEHMAESKEKAQKYKDRKDYSRTGGSSLSSYFRGIENKYCDLFEDSDNDIMPFINDGEYNPFI